MSNVLSSPVFSKPPQPNPQRRAAFPAIPPHYRPSMCCQCETALFAPRGQNFPLCTRCAMGNAANACHLIACQIRELVRGQGEFAVLTPAERQEQLAAIGTALQVAAPVRQAPVPRIDPHTARRIELRIAADQPTAAEREEIEARLEAEEEDDRRTAQERPDPYEIW